MLKGLIILLVFQLLGECVARFFSLLVPGPVIGMVLLLMFLIFKGHSFKSLDNAVNLHLKYLPLMFIPAAMGIITQGDVLIKEFWAIVISLILGTILALIVSAKLMDFLTTNNEKNI